MKIGESILKRNVSVRIGDYELKVEEFEDWIGAISELNLGSIIMRITFIVGPEAMYNSEVQLHFPDGVLTAKEKIVCSLLLRYPGGLSKDSLQNSTGIKPDSLATYLTSKKEGLAEGFEKVDEIYSIKKEKVGWALDIVSAAISKCEEKIRK
jgi:hypothetical protein